MEEFLADVVAASHDIVHNAHIDHEAVLGFWKFSFPLSSEELCEIDRDMKKTKALKH